MTTLERMEQISRRPWFIAMFRWTTVGLVPATASFCVWLVYTVYASQLSLASLDNKVVEVTRRVDAIDTSLDTAERERLQRRDRFAEGQANVASRLSALETGQGLMSKQLDRVLDILDKGRFTAPVNPNTRSLQR